MTHTARRMKEMADVIRKHQRKELVKLDEKKAKTPKRKLRKRMIVNQGGMPMEVVED